MYVFRFQFKIKFPFVSCSLLSKKYYKNIPQQIWPPIFLAKIKVGYFNGKKIHHRVNYDQ